jgi:hypothetical protein
VVATLAKHLPPTAAAMKTPNAPPTTPSTNAAAPEDRDARFDRLYGKETQKIDRRQYLAKQPKGPASERRFERWDVNHDGLLTREEFVTQGGTVPVPAR